MIFNTYKAKVEDFKKPFDVFYNLWEQCKKFNEVPTQIVIGSKVFKYLLKDETWKRNFYSIPYTEFQPLGLVGRIQDIDILTDFYVEDEDSLGWSIEEDEVLFNIGNKLVGKL